jgi:hypothetical protein
MAVNLSAFAGVGAQFFNDSGVPLSGGLLYSYEAGTTTPATTWTTNTGTVANTNPIVLDSAGRTPNEIWITGGADYKFILKTSTGVTVGTYDDVPSLNDFTAFNNLITVTGTNSLIGTSVPPYTAYTTGMTVSFAPVATNTGAVTLDLDGLGAKNVNFDASTALNAGAIAVGKITTLQYDGTRFQMTNSVTTGQIPDGAITAAKLATDSVTTIKILDLNVTTGKLADNAVTTIKITDANVTPAKLSTGAPSWNASGVFTMNSGYGSNAAVYGCRVWVNFNGTGTVAIRASGNVTSITDNGTGDYTLNFTTAMPDANYSVSGVTGVGTADAMIGLSGGTAQTASLVRFVTINSAANFIDNPQVHVQVHR